MLADRRDGRGWHVGYGRRAALVRVRVRVRVRVGGRAGVRVRG